MAGGKDVRRSHGELLHTEDNITLTSLDILSPLGLDRWMNETSFASALDILYD